MTTKRIAYLKDEIEKQVQNIDELVVRIIVNAEMIEHLEKKVSTLKQILEEERYGLVKYQTELGLIERYLNNQI